MESLAPNKAAEALDHVRNGGRLIIATQMRTTIIDAKVLKRFEAVDEWLLKADGNGYRVRSGKGSVYTFPGQLKFD